MGPRVRARASTHLFQAGNRLIIKGLAATREPKSFAASLSRKAHNGAIFSGPICWILATRAFSASVSVGMVPIRRLQANGETQFERTLKRFMSSAIDFDRPTMPSLAAA